MNTAATIWLVIIGIAAALFFVTAVVISVLGARDLRDLLSHSKKTDSAPGKGA